MILLALLLLGQAGAVQKTRLCDKTNPARCATVDGTGAVSISGTINATSATHNTASAPTYVEGTDNAFSGDLSGSLRIVCMGGTCGGSSPFADNAAFTGGSTSVSVTAGVFNDSLTALVSGKAGAPRMTSFRALHFNLRDNSGNEIPFPAALDADLGFKVHVQNAVAVTGTFWQATQPVSGTFWQATQPVSGPLTDTQLRASAVPTTDAHTTAAAPLSLRLSDGAAFYKATTPSDTQPVSGAFWQATQPVSGTVAATQSGTWTVQPGNTANTTAWKVDGSAVTQPVSGTFWQATQPVSGTFFQATQPVSNTQLPAALDGSGFLKVHEQGTATVSGTVAATESGTWTVQPGNTQNTTAWLTATPDTSASGSLSTACADPGSGCAGTAFISLAAQGIAGIGAKVVGTTLVGDQEACDISYDGATTWVPNACAWHDPITERTFTGKLSALASTTVNYTLIVDSGVTHVRIRMAVLTSGTAAITLRGVTHTENLAAMQLGVPGQLPPPGSAQLGLKAIANATAPTNATAGNSAFSVSDLAGRQMVQTFHPNLISCNVAVSTATTITAFGGSCAAPGAGLSIYITDITFSASAASGTAADAMPTIKSGTGGTCGTATAVVFEQFNPANGGFHASFQTPIRVGTITELCWIDSTAGSKAVHINGFIAP